MGRRRGKGRACVGFGWVGGAEPKATPRAWAGDEYG